MPAESSSRRFFGEYALTANQVRVLMLIKAAVPRWVVAAEVEGAKMPTFYRLRGFDLIRSRMTPGGRHEPRYGLIWTVTKDGLVYLDKLIAELAQEETT